VPNTDVSVATLPAESYVVEATFGEPGVLFGPVTDVGPSQELYCTCVWRLVFPFGVSAVGTEFVAASGVI
jgi:hypothetical protein